MYSKMGTREMFKAIVEKEVRFFFQSAKFVATFCVGAILILLSVLVGTIEYRAALRQYESATSLNEQSLRETSSYGRLQTQVHRKPDAMQIFVSGVQNDIGRLSFVEAFAEGKLTNSIYSDDPIFAVFRFLDFAFIVRVVLSLFAILFTYDAINGERELGTLRLVFSNAIARTKYVAAKLIGSWLGLVVPLCIPVMLGILLVLLLGIELTADHWLRLALFLLASLLFFTFFVVLGLLTSALTRRSSVSFLFSLVAWVIMVLVAPRASIMAANYFIAVPSQAEVEGQRDVYSKQAWKEYEKDLAGRWQRRQDEMQNMSDEERKAYREAQLWDWMEEDEEASSKVETLIHEFAVRQTEDLRNRKARLQRLAFALSKFSPAAAFQLIAMNLAGTNIDLKTRYEDAIRTYRDDFLKYRNQKVKEAQDPGGIRVSIDSESGMNISVSRDKGSLDLSDMPRFQAPHANSSVPISATIMSMGIIAGLAMAVFSAAFAAFIRYDVR